MESCESCFLPLNRRWPFSFFHHHKRDSPFKSSSLVSTEQLNRIKMRLFSLALSALSLVSTMSVSSVLSADVPKGPKITNIVYFDIKVSISIHTSPMLAHADALSYAVYRSASPSISLLVPSPLSLASLCRYACFSICDAFTQHGDQDLGRITMVSIYEHPNT